MDLNQQETLMEKWQVAYLVYSVIDALAMMLAYWWLNQKGFSFKYWLLCAHWETCALLGVCGQILSAIHILMTSWNIGPITLNAFFIMIWAFAGGFFLLNGWMKKSGRF